MSTTEDADDLRARARALTRDLEQLAERKEILRAEQIQVMNSLHAAGESWVDIGKLGNMTATAAMYATNHAKRTPRRKATNPEPPGASG